MTISANVIIYGRPMSVLETLRYLDSRGCIDINKLFGEINEKWGIDLSKFADKEFLEYYNGNWNDDDDEKMAVVGENIVETLDDVLRSYEYFHSDAYYLRNGEQKKRYNEYYQKYREVKGFKILPEGETIIKFTHDTLDRNVKFINTPIVIGRVVSVFDYHTPNPEFKMAEYEKIEGCELYVATDDCGCCS